MEDLAQGLTARRLIAAAGLLVLTLATGCTTTAPFLAAVDAPPAGPVYQVVATWKNEVQYAPDPTHGGAMTPGLAGRLYLFGPQIDFPLEGDGSVVVDLYNESPGVAGGQPVMLEEWRLDHDTLQRLLRKDVIGWGYTLFLPWGTCRPDVTQVRLRLRYDPAHGSPLYTESGPLTVNAVQDFRVSNKDTPAASAAARGPAAAASPVAANPAAGSGVRPASAGEPARPGAVK